MKTPKRIAVSKRPSAEQIKNSERWNFFLSQCQIDWESLSEESRDFFASMGSTESSEEDINNAVDLAMKGDTK
jgi:hypothetical protein